MTPRQSLAKVARARTLIAELTHTIDGYLAQHPLAMWSEYDRRQRILKHFMKVRHALPDAVPLIVGDVVHNLRSALDHALWAMIGDRAANPRFVQFPVVETEAALTRELRSREVALAGQAVSDAIRALKPYKDGNPAIWIVHKLDLIDKHRLLLATPAAAFIDGADRNAIVPGIGPDNGVGLIWPVGAWVGVVGVNPGDYDGDATRRAANVVEYIRPRQPEFSIAFGEEDVAQGPLLPLLAHLADQVEDAILSMLAAWDAVGGNA